MSQRAVSYVRSLQLPDPTAARVFLLLAERTETFPGDDEEAPMGLKLRDADIPHLAASLGITAAEFRQHLRALKTMVPMDVLEHPDGVWEIIYGPWYSRLKRKKVSSGTEIGGIRPFSMPGWDHYSTWGHEEGLGHLYAQLYLNEDDPSAAPRIWITPPRYQVTTVDELAKAIAAEIEPYYKGVTFPVEVIKEWLQKGI